MSHDRVRAHTASEVLSRIDDATVHRLNEYASATPGEVERALGELQREWDTDRVIEAEAAATGMIGLALGAFVDRRLLAIPALVSGAVFLHALTGWYPLLPAIRRAGIRSSREIMREHYALKALRGDFGGMDGVGSHPSPTSRPVDVS